MQSRSYPLATLFLLVALFAVLTAHLGPLANDQLRDRLSPESMLMIAAAAILGGAIYGTIIGLYHHQTLRGLAHGVATGITVGLLSAPIFANSITLPWQTLVISAGGSAVLLAVAISYRLINNQDPVSNPKLYRKLLGSASRLDQPD